MERSNVQIFHDQSLSRSEPLEPVYPFVTSLSLGLLKLYRLNMEANRIYLVDVGFNDVFVYDQKSARHRSKLFWKLNLEDAPLLKAESFPEKFDIIVEVKNIPNFDPKFRGRGGWVTIDYNIRIQLKVTRESVGQMREATNPLSTAQNAARRAARQLLPFMPYEETLIATAEEKIQQRIKEDPKVQSTGLHVVLVDVEEIEGSKKLNEALHKSFERVLKASDRREIALQFGELERDVFQRMLEAEEPGVAIEVQGRVRDRAADRMLQALLASGFSLFKNKDIASNDGARAREIYQVFGQIARNIGLDSLAANVADKAFAKTKPEDWPPLAVPRGISHEERLHWERQIMQERAPMDLQDAKDFDTFTFKLGTGDVLEIVWTYPEFPPRVYINNQDRTADYTVLKPELYDYHKVTVWDLYYETRRMLGDQQA